MSESDIHNFQYDNLLFFELPWLKWFGECPEWKFYESMVSSFMFNIFKEILYFSYRDLELMKKTVHVIKSEPLLNVESS